MIRLREILRTILERRATQPQGILAKRMGLEKKPGWGNYGLPGQPIITQRSIKGNLKPVIPHPIGQKPTLTGNPEPTIRPKGGKKPWTPPDA
jgi:hypothetical protein